MSMTAILGDFWGGLFEGVGEVFCLFVLEGRWFMRVFFFLVEFWVEKSCDDVSVAKVVNLGSSTDYRSYQAVDFIVLE